MESLSLFMRTMLPFPGSHNSSVQHLKKYGSSYWCWNQDFYRLLTIFAQKNNKWNNTVLQTILQMKFINPGEDRLSYAAAPFRAIAVLKELVKAVNKKQPWHTKLAL